MIIVSDVNILELKGSDFVKLKCENCGLIFERLATQVKSVLNGNKKTKLKYCSKKCATEKQVTKVEVECRKCDKKFFKLLNQIKRSKNNFCSRSCAASWNNINSNRTYGPKRKKFTYCKECKIIIKNGRKFCHKHTKAEISVLDKTIGELERRNDLPTNRFASIRDHARRVAKKAGLLKKCKICEYSKHVVTCHIRDISLFDKDTLVKEVNALSNLVGLCKNHHWEMDHDLLSKEDKRKLTSQI